jgi:RNA polymerase sigma-70 factor (ECF subfamily)
MPVQADPDAALMLRVKRGDRAAFTELVEKYKQPVMNFVYRSLRDEIEAEDLAQNVFLQVYKSRARYERTAKFSTWLFTIARNLCLNEIRRRSRHPAESLEETHAENEDQPSRQYEDKKVLLPTENILHGELAKKIDEALAGLPEIQRTAILLCRQDELSYEEIAGVLDCSLSATKSLIHRGRETLKEKLKPYLQTGEWTHSDGRFENRLTFGTRYARRNNRTSSRRRIQNENNPLEFLRILFIGDPAIPDSRRDEDAAAASREPDQKRRRQIKMRANCRRQRQSATEVRIKRARPRALQTFLENQLQRLVVARERCRAIVRAGHALRRARFGAIGA